MAKATKFNFNVDKLKICFKQNEETFNLFLPYKKEFEKENKPKFIDINRDGYTLRLFEIDEYSAKVNVIIEDEVLGMFTFNNSSRYEGLCFFKFENKALYTSLTYDVYYKKKVNLIPLISTIADDLDLTFNNITEIEVALDSNINVNAKVRKLIRNYKDFEMFQNGKRVKDPNRILENYHETFKRNRKKIIYPPTLYFEQAKNDAPLMRIYNKTEEINDNENLKDYITKWNDFGKSDIHRVEVRLKSNSIKDYLKDIDRYPLDLLTDPVALCSIWCNFVDRLVFFRDRDGQNVTVADLIS